MDEKFYDLLEKLYGELINVKTELKEEIQGVRTELKEEIREVRTELKSEIQELRETMATKEDLELAVAELKAETQMVYNEVKDLRKDLNTMEIIITKNAHDIALLKAVR